MTMRPEIDHDTFERASQVPLDADELLAAIARSDSGCAHEMGRHLAETGEATVVCGDVPRALYRMILQGRLLQLSQRGLLVCADEDLVERLDAARHSDVTVAVVRTAGLSWTVMLERSGNKLAILGSFGVPASAMVEG